MKVGKKVHSSFQLSLHANLREERLSQGHYSCLSPTAEYLKSIYYDVDKTFLSPWVFMFSECVCRECKDNIVLAIPRAPPPGAFPWLQDNYQPTSRGALRPAPRALGRRWFTWR